MTKPKRKTKELVIDGDTYVLQAMGWKDSMELTNKYTDFDYDAGTSDMDTIELSIERMLKCLIEAPFDITRENIEEMSEEVGNKLMLAMKDWFEIPKEDEKK